MHHKIYKFNNGLHLLYEKPYGDNKYSSINFAIEFGSIHEPNNQDGCAHFIEHMCFKGNDYIKSSRDLSVEFDKLGVYTNAYTEKKLTNYTFTCPNDNLLKTIDLLTNMLFFSTFNKQEFDKEYNVVLEENYRDKQDFNEKLNNIIDKYIYNGSCYAKPIDNISFHLKKKLKRDDLYDIYKKYYTPDKMVLSICSSFKYDVILKHCLNSNTSKYTSKDRYINYSLKLNINSNLSYKIITQEEKLTEVTYLSFAYRTCSYYNDDVYILNLIKNILSSGMSSRLFFNLREKHGLTYANYVECNYFEHSGDFTITCETSHNKLFGNNNVLDILVKTINNLIKYGIKQDELDKTRGYIQGQSLIALNDNRSISEFNSVNFISNNLNGSIKDDFNNRYKNITVEQINKSLKKYLIKDNLLFAIISNKKVNVNKIKPYIDKLII